MKSTKEKKKILFVCLGNICRSPAAEGIFKSIIEKHGKSNDYIVDSAGTSGYHIGDLPDKRMRKHGSMRGYDFNSLSRKFSIEDFLDFDYIITMDDSNYHNVTRLASTLDDRDKVKKMVDYLQKDWPYDHVPDPYYEGADGFELVLDLLEDACDGLYKTLEAEN